MSCGDDTSVLVVKTVILCPLFLNKAAKRPISGKVDIGGRLTFEEIHGASSGQEEGPAIPMFISLNACAYSL
jgi:hypothetical protein